MSDSLGPHGLQHARLPCPSLTPRACSNSYPLSRWYHPTISSSVVPFSSCIGRQILYHQATREARGIVSVQFSRPVVSDFLWPHGPQHTSPPCQSPTAGVYPNSHPLSQWCHPTISSSVIPFSSCPQSFPASGPFQMSQLFTSGGQSIRVSASTSVLPVNTQDWSPVGERKLTTRLLKRLLTNLSSYGRNPFKYFLYNTGQEATVRTRHGTDWFQIQTVFFDTQ